MSTPATANTTANPPASPERKKRTITEIRASKQTG